MNICITLANFRELGNIPVRNYKFVRVDNGSEIPLFMSFSIFTGMLLGPFALFKLKDFFRYGRRQKECICVTFHEKGIKVRVKQIKGKTHSLQELLLCRDVKRRLPIKKSGSGQDNLCTSKWFFFQQKPI